jgi:hypothetical protein
MFKVNVDISVVTEAIALGRLTGSINVPVMPQVGDWITLDFPTNIQPIEDDSTPWGFFKVNARMISANEEADVSLLLSNVIVTGSGDAKKVLEHFSITYDLFAEEYDS